MRVWAVWIFIPKNCAVYVCVYKIVIPYIYIFLNTWGYFLLEITIQCIDKEKEGCHEGTKERKIYNCRWLYRIKDMYLKIVKNGIESFWKSKVTITRNIVVGIIIVLNSVVNVVKENISEDTYANTYNLTIRTYLNLIYNIKTFYNL